ncbi:MAG: ribose-phosphate diphosphokinase [Spirochaetaceae bacterium]|jgi:ribose-phosphate pyrophosphokinase|nr:ribose-phosphate diphosphokinase [Spirochaetaceae bacterium]
MYYSNPANLAIVACPGGESFANQVIAHLEKQYHNAFNATVEDMSRRFKTDPEDVIKRIDFINEITTIGMNPHEQDEDGEITDADTHPRCPDTQLHAPQFKAPARFTMFPNGEFKAEILKSIRGKNIFIIQDVENHYPLKFNDGTLTKELTVNDHLMVAYVTVDAVRQAGAHSVTVVVPTYPYARQHKRKGREGVTANRIGRIFESLGANCLITLDIHSRDIGNSFCRMRLENLHASYQIIRKLSHIVSLDSEDFVVAAPDTGSIDRNKFYATALKKPLALIYKERDYSRVTKDAMDNNIADIKLLGNVKDKIVFMADDMLGTGGTLLKAMEFLKEQGAKKVLCAISLPLFSGKAIEFFDKAYQAGLFYRIIGTNAVYHEDLLAREWYLSVDVTKLFAQIISRIHQGLSISSILDNRDVIVKSFTKKI